MTAAVCSECRVEAKGNPAVIVHARGCPVGQERQRLAALNALGEASAMRDSAEAELERLRGVVRSRIENAAELGIPKTQIAEAANLERSRIYQLLG